MTLATIDTSALLASIAVSLNGGTQVFRIKDENVRAQATALVVAARGSRRRELARNAHAARLAWDALMASYETYAPDVICGATTHANECCSMGRLIAVWQTTPKRSVIRRIARAVLTAPKSCRNCAVDGKCDAHTIPADWRATVRAFRDGRNASRAIGSFALSRDDMRADSRSRFYRSAVTHWHNYAGGKHVAIHGVTPDDALQDAFVLALESRDGLTFAGMYGYTRQAVESARFTYKRMGNGHKSDNYAEWTRADWEDWAHQNGPDHDARVWSTDAEWRAYDAARDAWMAVERADIATAERRAIVAGYMEQSRRAIATLILNGMTVRQIATALGRTVDAIADGFSN